MQAKPISHKAAPTEHPVRAEEGFDTRVQIRDRETGKLIRLQHHTMHIFGDQKMYEQPPGSGNMFDPGGNAMGRWKSELSGRNTIWKKVSEDHIEAEVRAQNREEYLEQQLDMVRRELAERDAELAKKTPVQAVAAAPQKK